MCKENQNNDIYSKLIKFVSCNLEGQGLTDDTSLSLDLDNCYFNEIEEENLSTRPFGEEIKLMCLAFVDSAFLFRFWTRKSGFGFSQKTHSKIRSKIPITSIFREEKKRYPKKGLFFTHNE